jgi:polyisoprenyl-teichoic acid--peptidoglycan teichoic acid transferase
MFLVSVPGIELRRRSLNGVIATQPEVFRMFSTNNTSSDARHTAVRSGAPRSSTRRFTRNVAIAVLGTLAALSLTAPSGSVSAAAKTTKKSKSKKSAKTTTTKRRKPPAPAKGSSRSTAGLWAPNGRPPAAALNFDPNPPSSDKSTPSAKNETEAYTKIQPDGKVLYLLIVGTDARPGEKPEKSRGDAIHIFSYNPSLKQGALIGFPRDSYVTTPSGDQRKITEVLSTAGPDAFMETVNKLTGLKIDRYIMTGFDGFKKMVDGVGGVNVQVKPQMNDKASGATFQEGWFQFNGNAALAFSRARKTLPQGDIDRSANQNKLMLFGFSRLRESTDNIRALLNWVLVIKKYTFTNLKPGDFMYYAQVARSIDPATMKTRVIGGTNESIGGSDVIKLDDALLKSTMQDLQDGVLGN